MGTLTLSKLDAKFFVIVIQLLQHMNISDENSMIQELKLKSFCTIWILCGWKFHDPRAQSKELLHWAQTLEVFFIYIKRGDLWIVSWGLLSKCYYIVVTCSWVTADFRPDFLYVVILPVFTNFTRHFLKVVTFIDAFLNFSHVISWHLLLLDIRFWILSKSLSDQLPQWPYSRTQKNVRT